MTVMLMFEEDLGRFLIVISAEPYRNSAVFMPASLTQLHSHTVPSAKQSKTSRRENYAEQQSIPKTFLLNDQFVININLH